MDAFDKRVCQLGEGPLWHPERQQLFWFDILGQRLLSVAQGRPLCWEFDEMVSAAGWVDRDTLLIASASALFTFNLETGQQRPCLPLEADNALTRSNDGRADPFGGFWIGTMGRQAETGAGTLYRYFRGALEPLCGQLSIPNAICFAPDRRTAYFADTPRQQIMAQPLDGEGWPVGAARLLIDLSAGDRNPDGAVVDAEGCLWVAFWGAGEVARITPRGVIERSVRIPATQPSCPAFGGAALDTLFVTSATEDLTTPAAAEGRTFAMAAGVVGQAEHRVIIG